MVQSGQAENNRGCPIGGRIWHQGLPRPSSNQLEATNLANLPIWVSPATTAARAQSSIWLVDKSARRAQSGRLTDLGQSGAMRKRVKECNRGQRPIWCLWRMRIGVIWDPHGNLEEAAMRMESGKTINYYAFGALPHWLGYETRAIWDPSQSGSTLKKSQSGWR